MTVEGSESKTILLEGPATIYEVAAIRETLREALNHGHDLRLDLSDSGKWDLAGLQLLVATVNTARALGRHVQLVGVPPACHDLAARSGLAGWLEAVAR